MKSKYDWIDDNWNLDIKLSSMSFFYPLPTAGLCALPRFTSIKTRLHTHRVLAAKELLTVNTSFFAIVVDSVSTGLDLMVYGRCT